MVSGLMPARDEWFDETVRARSYGTIRWCGREADRDVRANARVSPAMNGGGTGLWPRLGGRIDRRRYQMVVLWSFASAPVLVLAGSDAFPGKGTKALKASG